MSSKPVFEKLEEHFLAGAPAIYIHSAEEARVDQLLIKLKEKLGLRRIHEWNLAHGWVDFDNKRPQGNPETVRTELEHSLLALLDADLEQSLVLIKGARLALENNSLATARLKQLLNTIERHHAGECTVILVSEAVYIPAPIESQVTLLPLPLPDREEIKALLAQAELAGQLIVPDPLNDLVVSGLSGLTISEIEQLLKMVSRKSPTLDTSTLQTILREKEQIIAKSGVLEMVGVDVALQDIGGLENLKHWLEQRATIIRRLDEAAAQGVKAPKGVLIAGMPGCGKSLTAKVAASLFQLPLLRLDIGSLLGKYVGESEHNMRRALSMAETVSPCILWVDELEKAFVGMGGGNASEVTSRLLGYFLTWMQEKTGAVFVIATANDISALPPELLRKGRFDEIFYVDFPNNEERQDILNIHLKKSGQVLTQLDIPQLAKLCRDYSGADIENAVNEALTNAFIGGSPLTQQLLVDAIKSTIPLRETLRDQVSRYEELFEKLKLRPSSQYLGLSVAQMIKMADDPNEVRREEVAANPDCPDDLLERLAADRELSIRTAVYKNPRCPERLLTLRINIEEGQQGYDEKLLHLACVHSNAPHDLLARQFTRLKLNSQHKVQLASSPHTSLHKLLLKDADISVRRVLAENPQLEAEAQQLLARDLALEVRRALAVNARDVACQIILTDDDSLEVRDFLTYNAHLTEPAQLKLTKDPDMDIRCFLVQRRGANKLYEQVQRVLLDDHLEVRTALAKNEQVVESVQALLAQDREVSIRAALAGNKTLSHAVRETLSKDCETVRVALAANQSLSSALLQMGLAQDASSEVREKLAKNPNLIEKVQLKLLEDADESIKQNLAGNDNAAMSVLTKLLSDESSTVRKSLIQWNRELPADFQEALAQDEDMNVRRDLARSGKLSEHVQALLLEGDDDVRRALASSDGLSDTLQLRLATDESMEVRESLASREKLIEPVQCLLANDESLEVRVSLARRCALVPHIADQIAGDHLDVQTALSKNRHLPELHYEQLAKSAPLAAREALAANSALSETVLTILDKQERSVRIVLARNACLPSHLQTSMAKESSASADLMEALAANLGLDETVQTELASHGATKVRESLAGNPELSVQLQQKLMNDRSESVRIALAKREWLDVDIEKRLLDDTASGVRGTLASNERLRIATQLELARDDDLVVRTNLLQSPEYSWRSLGIGAQQALANDSDEDIRELLAVHRGLRSIVQLQLANDESYQVRVALARQTAELWGLTLTEDTQRKLATDSDVNVRVALAQNSRLLESVQLILAVDAKVEVRTALIESSNAWSSNLRESVQLVLAQDSDVQVREALAEKLSGRGAPKSTQQVQSLLVNDAVESVRDIMNRDRATIGGLFSAWMKIMT